MAIGTFYTVRKHIHNILAQGLHVSAPDELDGLAQGLSELHLEQPATLIKQIHQNVVSRKVEKKDVEALVKVLQILSQAEIHLSEVATVQAENLIVVQGRKSVYVDREDVTKPELENLNEIIRIPNQVVRGHWVAEYCKTASYEKLVQSIEIAWFDYGLSNVISDGLRERPEEALKLAQIALNHKNWVIQRTAIKVLERVGAKASKTPEVLDILANWFKKPKEPMKHIIEETVVKIEGKYDEYLAKKQKTYAYKQNNIKQLSSSKKNTRYAGIYGLTSVKDPYFTDVLARALAVEDDQKIIKFLLQGLIEIGGFEAIGAISRLFDGPYAHQALEAVSKFGDRSVLTFLFSRIDANLPAAYYRNFLPVYGDLAVEPLLDALKTMENPEAYKGVFTTIFTVLRSDALTRRIIESIERDAAFAQKFAALMQTLYPKLFKKADAKKKAQAPAVTELKQVVLLTLGGTYIDLPRVTRLFLTPDGQALIALSYGRGVHIFSTTTWKQQTVFATDTHFHLIAPAFDGKYLLSTRFDATVRKNVVEVWQFGRWEQNIAAIEHSGTVEFLATTSNGKYFLIGGEKTVRVVEFDTWREVIELTGHEWRVTYIQPIPGKNLIMTGDWQGWLQVWDTTTWNLITKIKSDSWAPKFAELSRDGKLLVYAGYIGIKVWETESWQEIISVSKPKGFDYMTLTLDGKYLIVAKTKSLRFLEFGSWKEVLKLDNDENIACILVTPDGKHVIIFGGKGIKVWNVGMLA